MTVTCASFTLALDVFVTDYSFDILTNFRVCVLKKFMSRTSVLVETFVHVRMDPRLLFNNKDFHSSSEACYLALYILVIGRHPSYCRQVWHQIRKEELVRL
jgi:hypothetical protein